MGKKRKAIATKLDEADRTMYASFSSAANSLSQLYSQALNHQKLSFQDGERHGLDKLYQWILRQQEGGSRLTAVDILNYIQNELDHWGEEQPSMSRMPVQHQHFQPSMHFTNSISSGSSAPTNAGQITRSEHSGLQPRNSVFSNALSSPVRSSLQHHHITQGGYYPNNAPPLGNGVVRNNNEAHFPHHQSRDSNPLSSNDSSMDMHADSPARE